MKWVVAIGAALFLVVVLALRKANAAGVDNVGALSSFLGPTKVPNSSNPSSPGFTNHAQAYGNAICDAGSDMVATKQGVPKRAANTLRDVSLCKAWVWQGKLIVNGARAVWNEVSSINPFAKSNPGVLTWRGANGQPNIGPPALATAGSPAVPQSDGRVGWTMPTSG